METRLAAISLIVSDSESVESINSMLHDYRDYIVGRMGIPYKEKGLNIIYVAIDAPADVINGLTGKLGRLNGVHVKAVYN